MVIETHGYTHRRGRVGLFVCECGCGQEFFADYKTRHPKYYSKTHRARAYRARAKARIEALNFYSQSEYAPTEAYDVAYEAYLEKNLSANRGRL